MGYNFQYHKNTFYWLNIHLPVRISKNISGQMVLSCLPWPVFLIDFTQNPPLDVNFTELHDAIVTLELIFVSNNPMRVIFETLCR